MALFISSIPYMMYPWIAIIMVPLVATGRIPLLGPMRAAEQRAGQLPVATRVDEFSLEEIDNEDRVGLHHFLVPILVMLGVSIYADLDV